jgi:hypothetical protein
MHMLFNTVRASRWPVLFLLPILMAPVSQAWGQNVPKTFTCAVSDAQSRPQYIQKLNQMLAATEKARRELDILMPEFRRFLDIYRKSDPNYTWASRNDYRAVVDGLIDAYITGKLSQEDTVWALTHAFLFMRFMTPVLIDAPQRMALGEIAGSIEKCISFQKQLLAHDLSASAPPPAMAPPLPLPPQVNQPRPWSGSATGRCLTTYQGYTTARGDYVKPAPPYNAGAVIRFDWDDTHHVYVVHSGSQYIIGPGPSFSYTDQCNQDSSNYQPGCLHKSRSDFTSHGTITTVGDTITLNAQSEESANFTTKKSVANCTFHKDK